MALQKFTAATQLGAGSVVQVVTVEDSAVASGSTAMLSDDSIPQNTEGTEFMTLAITPTSATNKLIIEVVPLLSNTTASQALTMALFQDANVDAIAATFYVGDATSTTSTFPLTHTMTSGTTSETTFKVRAGSSVGTVTLNGFATVRRYAGVAASSIVITEVAA